MHTPFSQCSELSLTDRVGQGGMHYALKCIGRKLNINYGDDVIMTSCFERL